ncbi:helix-turn-helix domain-containing protein [Gordonia sp. ABKF26]|uniref:helix-turn-helix domain-containing protein n=1 Tax=Gordonia sp. ABKF26 TaxID=3238687 RepID=UPI0034E476F2
MSPFVSIQQAADHLSVSPKTVRRWIGDGRLTAHRAGPRLIRIPTAELDRMMGSVGPSTY